jgi:hypothetical protein
MLSPRRYSTLTLIIGLLAVAGCKDREVVAYRAPKDPAPAAVPAAPAAGMSGQLPEGHPPIGDNSGMPGAGMGGGAMANTAVPTAEGDGLRWTAPAGWEAKPLSPMRRGSYRVKGAAGDADLSITAFPGATGGLEANLNRWRGQVGLPTLSPTEVVADAQTFTANDLQFTVVDYKGSASHMLGAIVSYGGNSWFFKLSGPDATITETKAAYLEFLHTVKAP